MLNTPRAMRGMITAPHHLAAGAGLAVLREGGNAIEAMVAAAATIAVVYPHMCGLGGDGFWLLAAPGTEPLAIHAAGRAAAAASIARYRGAGCDEIPPRGPLAALTVAGTVSGWARALALSATAWGGRLPLHRLLADAIAYARGGVPITAAQANDSRLKHHELADVPGFAAHFLVDGQPPAAGHVLANPALAATLERLAAAGLDDFYRGDVARTIAGDLAKIGSPLTLADLEHHRESLGTPLALRLPAARLFNLGPPTQGLASLLILGLVARLGIGEADGFDHLHGIIEATKRAFAVRDRLITDPDYGAGDPGRWLSDDGLARLAASIAPDRAQPWTMPGAGGETVWLGAIDGDGRAVSFIQSLYWEFGSGVVLPRTGILWQNRGASFSLDQAARQPLTPGRLPFHTLNPALARFDDGRTMVYGTMGGDGQPQTQAAIFSRYALFGQPLQAAVTAPRWLLGRTWGSATTALRIEDRFPPAVITALRAAGHPVELAAPFDAAMGHAGALVRHRGGLLEGASDPRSDGAVAAW